MKTINVNYEGFKGKGLSGLENLGNTCFMNSCLQAISHTYELHNVFKNEKFESKLNKKIDTIVFLEWIKLQKLMWEENCVVRPCGFLNVIQQIARKKGKDIFTGFAQNDMPEFLLFFIEALHNSINREVEIKINGNALHDTDKLALESYKTFKQMYEKDYSEILDIFYGFHISVIKNVNGDNLAIRPEPFMTLDLPIPRKKSISILDCFDLYTAEEKLDGDNQYYNEKSKQKEDATKNISFWNLPNVLIITLKRFDLLNNKNNCLIDCPLKNLDLTKYVLGYNKSSFIYDCYAICNHMGGTNGGHYTCFVNNNDKWFCFNDSSVQKINTEQLITPSAYCLFYRKKKTN